MKYPIPGCVFLTAGPSLAASLEPLAHRGKAASFIFDGYYFGRCSSELVETGSTFLFLREVTHYCNKLNGFSVTILRC